MPNPVPFIQSLQGTNVASIPTHSDVVLQPQVVAPNAPKYPDFYLPDAMNSKLSQVVYVVSNIKTSDGNSASTVEMDNLSW